MDYQTGKLFSSLSPETLVPLSEPENHSAHGRQEADQELRPFDLLRSSSPPKAKPLQSMT
jgi:hypothetical protein